MRVHSFDIGVLAGVATVLLAAGTRVADVHAQQPTLPVASGPRATQWVPLEYEYSITTSRGVLRYVEYRSGDGSTFRTNRDHDEVQFSTSLASRSINGSMARGHNRRCGRSRASCYVLYF